MVTTRRSANLTSLFFFTALVISALGCAGSGAGERGKRNTAVPDHLVGSWDANFYLGELGASSSIPRDVRGTLSFVRIRSGSSTFPHMATPINYGLYDIDFSPYGFDSREDGFLPGAVASATPTRARGIDSVFIVLEPEQKGVSVSIRGELRGDRAEGAWTAESPSRAGIAEFGRFTMIRNRAARM